MENKAAESAQRYVNIYTEANPNPASMKFAINFMLIPEGMDYDFSSPEQAIASPLATALFGFDWVDRVFFMSNFITVTKKADTVDWYELIPEIKSFIKKYLEEAKPIISMKAIEDLAAANSVDEPEVVTKIKTLLDEYVRPAVESDGGAISFSKFTDGVVEVELRGSCSGCPSSTLTLKSGIENLLKRMVPEVKEVVATGV